MRRGDLPLVLFVYVLPLLLVSGFLALSGLGGLALALLVVEGAVVLLTVLARRRPARTTPAAPTRRPWLVPLGMLVVLAGIVGVAVVGSHTG